MSNNFFVDKENNPSFERIDLIEGKLFHGYLVRTEDKYRVYMFHLDTTSWEPRRVINTDYEYMAKKAFRRYVARVHRTIYRMRDKKALLQRYNSYETERGTHFVNEHGDCTVVTLSVLAKVSYSEAHAIAKSAGRRDGKGMRTSVLLQKAVKEGVIKDFTLISRPGMTVATFCKKNPVGRFAVIIRGHVLAMIDGKIIDLSNNLTCRVKRAWKIEIS